MFAVFSTIIAVVLFGMEIDPEIVAIWSTLLMSPILVLVFALFILPFAHISGIGFLEDMAGGMLDWLFSVINTLRAKIKGADLLYFQEVLLSAGITLIASPPLSNARVPNILQYYGFGMGIAGLSFAIMYFYNLRKKTPLAG